MKTFTKHILLLALMLFGALGASAKVYTTLQVGDVIHVGDQINPGEFSRIEFGSVRYNCNPGQNIPMTLVRADLGPYSDPEQTVNVTESETGAYYAFKYGNNNYLFIEQQRISTTENSDGLVVTSVSVKWSAPYIVFAVHEFDPYAPALDETTGNWNFLMPGSNKVVKVTYKAEPALAWTYGNRAIPNDTTITAYRGFELPVIGSIGAIMDHDFLTALLGGTVSLRYGSTNPAVISFIDPNNMYSFSVNGAGECNVYMVFDGNDDFQDDSVAFHAVIANPYTLTLAANNDNMGTVSALLGGGSATWTTETWANLPTGQNLSPLTYGDITVTATGGGIRKYDSDPDPIRLTAYTGYNHDITFSSNGGNFSRIEMTCGSSNPFGGVAQEGWTVTPGDVSGSTAVWEGDAPSVTVTSCTTMVSQITFTRGIDSIVATATEGQYLVIPGAKVQVVATAVDGAHVSAWSPINRTPENLLSDTATFTVGETMTVTATFAENPLLTLEANNSEWGTVTLDGVTPGVTTYNITISENPYPDVTYTNVTFPFHTTVFIHEGLDEVEAVDQTPLIAVKNGDNADITINGPYGGTIEYSYDNHEGVGHKAIFCEAVEGLPIMPEGVTYAGYDNYLVLPGTEVTVVAAPDTAYYFKNWTGEADAISNEAVVKTLTMGTAPATLTANFQAKPTLTLAQTDGGTLEAIVPQGGGEETLLGTFTGGSTTIDGIATLNPNGAEYDGNTGWGIYTNNTDMTVTIAEGVNVTKVKFIGNKGGYYEDTEAPYQVTLYQYYAGFTNSAPQEDVASIEVYGYQNVAANVIASSTPNTYIIDYGTPVTVKATPDAQHYLVRFSDDDPATELNSNLAVEKTYDSVIADIPLSANFQAKPTLTLTANDGGTLTLDGMTEPTPATAQLSVPGSWAEDFNHVSPTNMPTDFQAVDENVARAWQNTTGKEVYLIFAEDDGEVVCYNFYEDGSYDESSFKPFRASIYELVGDGGLALYTTGAIGGMPAGVVSANATRDTFVVDYNTDVTVVATPDSIHYLKNFSGFADTNSNTAVAQTYTITDNTTATANFAQKPTLTLAHNDGGEMEVIVPQGGVTAMHPTTDQIPTWSGNTEYAMEADLQQFGFVAVDSAAAAAWTGVPASGQVLLVYALAGNQFKAIIFQDGQWYGTYTSNFYKAEIYAYTNSDMIYFTTGAVAPNVIASSTPNTYYIDYNTSVTVKATPDATHYLVNFDGTDVRNDNDTAFKTYENITAPFTSTATFQAKPTLALTSNEGGEMSLPGYTPSSFTVSTFEFPASWSDVSMSEYIKVQDLPTDFTPVTEAEMRNWNPGIEGNYIVFFRPFTEDRAVIAKYVNGVANSYSLIARKKTAASTYEGYQIYYVNSSTPAVYPEGVVAANNTLDTFVVDYNTSVTVKATPSDTTYLVRFDQDADTNSNVAVEKLYGPLTAALTTAEATFNDKPVLTLAANDTTWGKVSIELAMGTASTAGEVQIGDGTGTTYYFPIDNYFNYSCTEQIYTADEIGTAGTINSISFYYNYGTAYTASNVTMYLKHVSRSEFAANTDCEPLSANDIVWTGSIAPTEAGWYTFTLDTPFEYNGTDNLMVAFFDGTSGYPGTSYTWRQTQSPNSANMALRYYSDSQSPDPYNLSGYTGSKSLYTYRGNIKIDITPVTLGLPEGVVKLDSVTYRVDYGTTVTVQADATELHHVKNWVDADSVAYPADSITYSDYFVTTPEPLFPAFSTLTLTVTADTVTKAIFGINSYDVFARVDTTEDVRGTVRAEYIDIDGVSQSVAADDTVTYTAQGGSLSLVIATPTEPGYHFERWTDTLGAELGTNDTLEVTEAAAVIAVFDTNVYQISGTVAEGSEEWGEVTGSGDYRHFTQATLEALPIEHYHFVKWEDGNTENPRVIDVVGPESHQAEFAIDRFIVSWSSNDEAMGHVVGPYDNHTTGAPIPRLRGSWGTTFQLVAQPAEHHMLDYWSSGQTTDIIQHTITGNAELVAYFKHVPYIVTVLSEDETMGTVAGTDTLEWQESTEISATANYGYHFTMWNDGVTDNPRTVVNNIESDQTFTASFAKNEYTVTVVSADETMGSVAGTDTVEYLDEIEISATANEHYHFVQWNDGETANPRTVSVTKNETYTATFAPNVYTLTLGSNNAIMGSVALTAPAVTPNADGSYSIAYGTAVTVKGSASSRCFELGSWSDGAVVTADGSHSFSMAGNLVLTATFVNHLFRSDTVADVCDRFVWHGIAYTETPDVAPLHRLTTVDGCDSALVLNLTVRHSSTGVDEQVHCTPYTWIDGVTYSESNHTAQYILPGANAEQCDSIVTLDLTIGTQAESTEVVNACDSYEWHGVVYTETPAEAPTHTYHTLEGCDSTVTLQLTIGHPTEGIETIVACAPIEWHGTVYSESTDEPTWHTTNAAGCDSTVTLHLTIAPAIETEETVEACDEYEWHGVVYTETPAEAPTYTTVSVQGCDSTVTLHLTVNHSTAAVETVVACNSYEWHGVSYASSTTVPTYTTTGSNGCDSTTTLHLTINRSTSAVETVEACDSYEWHGTTYTASTSLPTYTTEGSNGCDSTTTLNLTIKQSSRATETVVTCDEYEWHGVLFTETPVEAPTYTTEGSNGCDSTVTLNLTVNHSADVVETIGACAAIEWHGTVYSESTTEPIWHSTTVAGCDSTVTLHLTISDRIETEETVVACDSYEWHGVVYTASTDNATWSSSSIQGCDSTVTLHLTINRSTTGSETIEACESYEWHGVTYRQSGSYTFDTLNVAGCDSTVTLTLTLHQPTSGSEFVTTCGSYVWHEVTYTQSGAYVWHGTDVHGCDSTVTLLLTILQPVYSTENRTACNSYTWHGTEYSESGDYTWSTTAVSGCDSIVTLHLTINLPVTSDVEESACERYTWNGIVYSTSGDYVQTFTGVNGCDSTVTLHLTVNMPATETLGVTACDSYEWHEVTYTESGVYSWHGTTVAGCDSTATLNLTIGHSADTTISLQGEGSIVWNGETFTQSGTYERVIRTVLGCDSTVTLNLVILPEGFVMPYLYNIMDVVLTINHFQQGETNLQYHWYRWYRNGKMVAEGRAMDTYSEGGSKLNGVYYLEVAIDESLEYWVRSNEVTIGTVGIDEAEDIDFTVAPNPVMHGSTVSVAVEGADVQGAVISVYDVQGREVLRQQNSAFIEAPAASGMYMVRLTLNDGRTAVKRLIVR